MRTHKERITLEDHLISAISKLAEGNPGALSVLTQVLKNGAKIDPDAGGGEPFFIVLNFDSVGLYGPKIWMLYKDVCGQRLDYTIAMLRAVQLGFLSSESLSHAVDHRGEGLNVQEMCARVKERLPRFTFEENK